MRHVLLLLVSIVLAACSSNDTPEESKVAELVEFDSTVNVDRVWTVIAGKGQNRRRFTRFVPAIDDDKIFTADAKGNVFAFDIENGKRLWQADTDFAIAGAVTAAYGLVLFGTFDAEVVALDASSGEFLWKASASSEILASPATNGAIVVAQTIDGRVFAFDAKSGEPRWSYDHIAPVLSLRGTAGPVMTSTQVICAFDNGQIISFSSSDGSRTWEARASQPKGKTELERIVDIDGTPLVESGLVYVGSYQGNIMALSRGKGQPIWKRDISTYLRLASGRGKVFASTDRSRVVAYNAVNGTVIWENEQLLNRNISAPVVIGDYVAVVDEDNHMHLMSLEDGAFAHRFQPVGSGFRAPMLSKAGRLYVYSDTGELTAYGLRGVDEKSSSNLNSKPFTRIKRRHLPPRG